MNANDFFTKDVNRAIEGVVKADDEASLALELHEYVLTKEAETKLLDFLESYNSGVVNGAWISGFFGSGKSHLLKILAVVLENRTVNGQKAADIFLEKCRDNPLLKGALQKAVSIPSRSILFNIAQKSAQGRRTESSILDVFLAVLNEAYGYFYKQPALAGFERELDADGKLRTFKEKFEAKIGKSWDDYGAQRAIRYSQDIDAIYNEIYSSQVKGIIERKQETYSFSPEDFGLLVKEAIERDGRPGFRLNFFVDEVGQFVANNTPLMLSLQTVAETLNTKCRGQSWVTVTSQAELSTIVGEINATHGNDFSRIEARFAVKMQLTGKNSDEVIQKRLVDKTPAAIQALSPVYGAHMADFKTLYDFVDGSKKYATFSEEGEFINYYPFPFYQFSLFQTAMAALSTQGAFTGRYTSVGERSMLTVCQTAVRHFSKDGFLPSQMIPFDYWFDGIRNSIQPIQVNQILVAEQHRQLHDCELAIRILKALYLVKYVREFKATVRNLCVLLLDDLNANVQEYRKRIEACLVELESQSYLQHIGEYYEYLTDEEKSIDKEIKDIDCPSDKIAALYGKYAFNFSPNRRIGDRGFDMKIDDHVFGRLANPLAVNIITHLNALNGKESELVSRTLGVDELLIEVPQDPGFTRDLINYVRTGVYLQRNPPAAEPEGPRRRLLEARSESNRQMETRIQNAFRELIGRSTLYFSGEKVTPESTDGKANVEKAFNRLVTRTFSQYRLIASFERSSENDIPKFLNPSGATLPGLSDGETTQAENTAFDFVQQSHYLGRRVTMDAFVKHFEGKPYGWRIGAIDCVAARLFAAGRLEFTLGGSVLDERAIAGVLANTRRQGEIILTPIQAVTSAQMRTVKDFANDFFCQPFGEQTAKELSRAVQSHMGRLVDEVDQFLAQRGDYPFLEGLTEFSARVHAVNQKGRGGDFYFTEEFEQIADSLVDQMDRVYQPVKKMMLGEGREVYRRAKDFVRDNIGNLELLQSDDVGLLKELLASPGAYTNQAVMQMRAATERLQGALRAAVDTARSNALHALGKQETDLRASVEYQNASKSAQERVDAQIAAQREHLRESTSISGISQRLLDFTNSTYPNLLAELTASSSPDPTATPVRTIQMQRVSDTVRAKIAKVTLASSTDVDEYLACLKAGLEEEIAAGTKIVL